MQYVVMGKVCRIKMRQGCVRTKFDCQLHPQPNRTITPSDICERPGEKNKRPIIEDCKGLEEIIKIAPEQFEKVNIDIPSPSLEIKIEKRDMQDLEEASCLGDDALFNNNLTIFNTRDDQIQSIKTELEEATDYMNDTKLFVSFKSESKAALEEQEEISCSPNIEAHLPYHCDKCNFTAKYKYFLKEHLIKHSTERPFKCDKCPFAAKSTYVIKQHQLVHKDILEVELFRCSKCNYVSEYSSGLRYHRLTHLDLSEIEQTFPCGMCEYMGKAKQSLESHKWVHRDAKEER